MSHGYESVFGKGEPAPYSPSLKKVILEALHVSGGGHFGGSLSVIDILDVLYEDILRDAGGISRDRIVLSKGHAAIALYAVRPRLQSAWRLTIFGPLSTVMGIKNTAGAARGGILC